MGFWDSCQKVTPVSSTPLQLGRIPRPVAKGTAFWGSRKRAAVEDCQKCKMSELLTSKNICNFMQDTGVGDCGKGIVIVAPPRLLSEIGVGKKYEDSYIGRQLKDIIAPYMDLYRDTLILPATKCPIVSVKKTGEVVDTEKFPRFYCCQPYLETAIKAANAKLVICMGSAALNVLYGSRGLENLSAYHMAGYVFPDHNLGAWVTIVNNPDEVFTAKVDQEGQILAFSRQMKDAIGNVYVPLPEAVDYNSKVKILTEFYDVMEALTKVVDTRPEWFDFDYETNCTKPQTEGARLYSVSWSVDDSVAYSHPFGGWGHFSENQLNEMYGVFRTIMADERIKKSAHNLHMENSWTTYYLQQPVAGWGWDSMVAAHMLNTTRGTKSLKFQAFANFGFGPYNTHIKPFLKADDGGALNNIEQCPKMELLKYGGLDSVFGRAIRKLQMQQMRVGKRIENRVRDCFLNLYLPGAVTMSEMSLNGIRIDVDHYAKAKQECRTEQAQLEAAIQQDPAVLEFKRRYDTTFSLTSDDDVRAVFFDILGCTAKRHTSTGLESVDRDMLEEVEHPLAGQMLRWRKLEKIAGTFISQYTREAAHGIMHPDYNLHIAASGRSSSSRPNLGL